MAIGTLSRVVLEGVPRIHFFDGGPRCPEDFGFPTALRAVLEYLGDAGVGCNSTRTMAEAPDQYLGCNYAFGMVTSGLAFQQLWHPTGWEWGDDVMRVGIDPAEPIRRAFEALGYGCEIIANADRSEALKQPYDALSVQMDAAGIRARIVESIRDHGRPVLALGVIGPPECGLITGYDQGGDVIIGWNLFQGFPGMNDGVTFEPSGCYRQGNWVAQTPAIVLLGERGERPPQKESVRKAAQYAVQIAHTPTSGEFVAGLASFDAWAEAMERDGDFATDDLGILRERYQRHSNQVGNVAEGRWYAAVLLGAAAQNDETGAEHLWHAAGCYAAIHTLMWKIWNRAGGIGDDDEKVRTGTTAGARRDIAALLRQARDQDAAAVASLERALSV
jgi:hypothetical protein